MDFSNSSCQDFPDTVRSIGAYIIFYQGGTIYYGIYVQSSAEIVYNAKFTSGMDLAHFKM